MKNRPYLLQPRRTNPQFFVEAIHALRHYIILLKTNQVDEFTFENFRQYCYDHGIIPHHHNAWGALAIKAMKDGIIEWTGEYTPATSSKTHGHPVKIWRAYV